MLRNGLESYVEYLLERNVMGDTNFVISADCVIKC